MVTVSEERAVARLLRVPVERVRVRKHVVTETRQVEVEVRREELVITRELVPEAESSARAVDGPGDSEELVVVLHAEEPVVSYDVVPVERVTVSARRVDGTVPVTVDLAREVVEVDVDDDV